MDRRQEYEKLRQELDQLPTSMDTTVERAKDRLMKSRRRRRFLVIPASSVAMFFITFVAMVNLSSSFAIACGQIPFLRDLAAAVAFSPSLSSAVDNEFVQPIGQEQTVNGITARIEYVIVDQTQLNVFYTLRSTNADTYLNATPQIDQPDGQELSGYGLGSNNYLEKQGELLQLTADFTERDMPDSLMLTLKVTEDESITRTEPAPITGSGLFPSFEEYKESKYAATISFVLHFDPQFTDKGQVLDVNQTFVLDGQQLSIETVEIFPTHMRLNLSDNPENTAWLKSLDFYIENERGQRFEAISNGITATGASDSPFMRSHRLESSFFSQSKQLTLYVTDVTWLDKDMERVRIDLKKGKAGDLPAGVELNKVVAQDLNWELTFLGGTTGKGFFSQVFQGDYYDEAGVKYYFNSSSYRPMDQEGVFALQFTLRGYPYDVVYLSPTYSRITSLSEPIKLKLLP